VPSPSKIPTGLTGAAGEYYTVAELSRRGWLATVAIKNSPGTDVLAQKRPEFFIAPRNVVAGRVFSTHRDWLAKTSKSGMPHNDNPMRNISAAELAPWSERWDLLDSPAAEAPFLGPAEWNDVAGRFPRPEGYPGFA
jgi:hypothetical protein